jgi:undecaprenyl-diphosphatase
MTIHDVDVAISLAINRAVGHSPVFDRFVVFLTTSDLVKGGVVMAVIWGAWLIHTDDVKRNRGMLLVAIFGSLLALLLARVLAYAGPIRLRPLLDPQLHFRAPTGLPPQTNWTSWSSFPSDHAALFFALAWGVWLVSRRVGAALVLYILIVICLPRLYIGIHYFSDLFVGAVIGITCSAILSERPLRERLANPLLTWADRHPGLFYFVFALLTFQIATLFWDLRTALSLCGFST